MGDFDGARRWNHPAALLTTVLALLLLAGTAGVWIGRNTTGAQATPVPVATGSPVSPPWPATGTTGTPAGAGTVDAGLGWTIPNPGAAGPFSVTELGVPFGYRPDQQGAALAAVNAVVAGEYLAGTFGHPWAALGFLADPGYAARGGNPALERFFTGPVTPRVIGAGPAATASAHPARPAGGGRVVGVRVTPAAGPADAMRAVVLWQSFSREYRPDGRRGYTVRIEPVSVLLVWAAGDWKVSAVTGPPPGLDTAVLGVLPDTFPVPAESWHR